MSGFPCLVHKRLKSVRFCCSKQSGRLIADRSHFFVLFMITEIIVQRLLKVLQIFMCTILCELVFPCTDTLLNYGPHLVLVVLLLEDNG